MSSLARAASTRLEPIKLLSEADQVAVTMPTVTKGFHTQIPCNQIYSYQHTLICLLGIILPS